MVSALAKAAEPGPGPELMTMLERSIFKVVLTFVLLKYPARRKRKGHRGGCEGVNGALPSVPIDSQSVTVLTAHVDLGSMRMEEVGLLSLLLCSQHG